MECWYRFTFACSNKYSLTTQSSDRKICTTRTMNCLIFLIVHAIKLKIFEQRISFFQFLKIRDSLNNDAYLLLSIVAKTPVMLVSQRIKSNTSWIMQTKKRTINNTPHSP